jgi:small subunit ribosomal protein S8
MVDVIASLANNIKVSNLAKKEMVVFPHSKFREAIFTVLQKEGFIKSFAKKGKKVIKTIEVELAYDAEGKPKIEGVQLVSKSSRKLYFKADDVHSVRNGYGHLILTTPQGVMTDRDARKAKVGGEALFKIW